MEVYVRITGHSFNATQTNIQYTATSQDGRAKAGAAPIPHSAQLTPEQINAAVLEHAESNFPNTTSADRFTLFGGAVARLGGE